MYQPRRMPLLAAALLAAAAVAAPAQERGLQRLVPGGIDGNVRSYVARCVDGTNGTLHLSGDSEQICAIANGGTRRCARDWTLMQAGQFACNATGAR
jgi:hypothetical protein